MAEQTREENKTPDCGSKNERRRKNEDHIERILFSTHWLNAAARTKQTTKKEMNWEKKKKETIARWNKTTINDTHWFLETTDNKPCEKCMCSARKLPTKISDLFCFFSLILRQVYAMRRLVAKTSVTIYVIFVFLFHALGNGREQEREEKKLHKTYKIWWWQDSGVRAASTSDKSPRR